MAKILRKKRKMWPKLLKKGVPPARKNKIPKEVFWLFEKLCSNCLNTVWTQCSNCVQTGTLCVRTEHSVFKLCSNCVQRRTLCVRTEHSVFKLCSNCVKRRTLCVWTRCVHAEFTLCSHDVRDHLTHQQHSLDTVWTVSVQCAHRVFVFEHSQGERESAHRVFMFEHSLFTLREHSEHRVFTFEHSFHTVPAWTLCEHSVNTVWTLRELSMNTAF